MSRKKVTYPTPQGNKSVFIEICDAPMTEMKEKQMLYEFNKNTKAIEWVGGTTYYLYMNGYPRLKSSCLDELQAMFKFAYLKQQVPERKCFMLG